jgi:fatty-acyl-CoA synthase
MAKPEEPVPFDFKPLRTPLIQSHFKTDEQPSVFTKSIAEVFANTCKKYQGKEALVFRSPDAVRQSVTFTELLIGAEAVASELIDSGIELGDRVGLLGPNCPEWVMAEYGACLAGAVGLRLFSAFKSPDDLRFVLSKAGCKGLLFHPGFNGEFQELIESVVTEGNEMGVDVVLALTPGSGRFRSLNVMELLSKVLEGEAKMALEKRMERITAMDIVSIYLTSGSTGFPKLVALNSINILNQCPGQMARYGMTSDDVLLNDRPFSHVGCLSHLTVCPGLTRVIIDPQITADPKNRGYIFQVTEEERPTLALLFLYLMNTFLEIRETGKFDLSSLKLILTGGQVTPRDVLEKMYQEIAVLNLYGATEMAGAAITSTLPTDEVDVKLDYTGYPMPLTEVKIIDDLGEVCPIGGQGEMYIKSPLTLVCIPSDAGCSSPPQFRISEALGFD